MEKPRLGWWLEDVAQFVLFGSEIIDVVLAGGDSYANPLDDFHPVTFEAVNLLGIVGQ